MTSQCRREALKAGMLLGAGCAMGGANHAEAAVGAGPITGSGSMLDAEYDFGHTMLFMEEYYQGTLELLGRLSGEIGHINALSDRAVAVLKNGGTVWSSANIGHMPSTEQSEGRRGNPGIIRDHTTRGDTQNKAEMREISCDALKKGDMLFTNYCNRSVQAARDRGVYVVGIPVNYVNSEFWPEGYVYPNEDNLMLGDVSNEVLHSHIPHEQGLVHPPEIPYMAVCPSCVTSLGALHWMLSAEIASKLENPNATNVDKSGEYLAILTERVKMIGRHHMDAIRETAVEMARRIRAGGRWFVRSVEHTGFQSELVRVASGPWMPNTGDWDANMDRNVVIGIGPSSLDGAVPPGRLIDIADAGFDNFSPESGGVLTLPGKSGAWCPTSGIVGNIIQQMICAQWADEMARRGSIPFFLLGNYRGGRPFNRMTQPFAAARGY